MLRLLRASARREEPWRNGGGSTTCIAISPEDAALSDFAWRISLARIDRSGPFSSFPGVDRTLIPIGGSGLTLSANGRRLAPRQDGSFSFAGEEAVEAAIADGPVSDLNIMTTRGRARHKIQWIAGAETHDLPCLSDHLCIIALTPGVERSLGRFEPMDCLMLQRGERALIQKDHAPLDLLSISLWES